jgi:hypothetical protein
MKKRWLFNLTILCISILSAQTSPVTWSGELRFRSEADDRDFNLRSAPNLYTLSRIRLGAEASPAENISIKITMQDSRTFGQEASTIANSANIDLLEGFVKIDSLFGTPITVKLGRMQLAYGSERIIGGLGWHNYSRVFDGMLIRNNSSSMNLDLFFINVSDINTAPASVNAASTGYLYDRGIMMIGAYTTLKFIDGNPFDLYVIHERNNNQTKKDTIDAAYTTTGAYYKGKSGQFFFDGEAAVQLGANKGVDVSAYTAAMSAGMMLNGSLISSVSAHADLVSGTSATGKEMNTFTANYATGHKFYGAMDYFINFPVQTFNRGLMDLHLRSVLAWNDNVQSQVTLHQFSTMQEFASAGSLKTKALGQEVDVVTSMKYSKGLLFECGLGAFVPNTILRSTFNGSDLGLWGYFTTQVTL